MSPLPIRVVLLVFFLALAMIPVRVEAQQCIPLIGQKWPKDYVGVYVAGGVGDAQRKQVLFALNVWYSAQKWFVDSFEGAVGTPYLLYLADQPADNTITVSFFIGQNEQFAGRTLNFYYVAGSNTYVKVDVQINLPADRATNPDDLMVESIIVHELGHALGLGHSTISSDVMYPIDNYPQNYGLPSTLDLNAVYELKKSGNPANLGGSVCLSPAIPYGQPPWVQKNSAGNFVISFPVGGFESGLTYGAESTSEVNRGGKASFIVNMICTGRIPVKLVSASAQPDFGQSIPPEESLPIVLELGDVHQLSFEFAVPDSASLGTHTVNYRFGFTVLTTSGWATDVQYQPFSSSFQVIEPLLFTQTTPAPTANYPVTIENQSPNNAPPYPLLALAALVAIIIVALLAMHHFTNENRRVAHRKDGQSQAKKSDIFCIRCGTRLTADSDFCHKCGVAQR